MALTDAQKDRICYHLGYPGVTAGMPAGLPMPTIVASLYPIYTALAYLRPNMEAKAIELLAGCDAVETQLADALTRMQASAVGSITLNANEQGALETAYRGFQRRLANLLGCEVNSNAAGGAGGVCVDRSW